MADYYTQAHEIWFHYVILIRSNQEGFDSGLVSAQRGTTVLAFLLKIVCFLFSFWCELWVGIGVD